MRVLLDECLPRRLKFALLDHEVLTVPEAGWAAKKNGELLQLAAARFDVFVTMDRGLEYQQNLQDASIAIVVLECRTNRHDDLLALVPKLLDLLRTRIAPGTIARIAT